MYLALDIFISFSFFFTFKKKTYINRKNIKYSLNLVLYALYTFIVLVFVFSLLLKKKNRCKTSMYFF